MLTPAEATAAIDAHVAPLAAETCGLVEAAGRVLREALSAERDQPPFDRVALVPRCARGEVPEWSIGTVSKTVVGASSPWVRIPPSPPRAAPRPSDLVQKPLFLLGKGA